MVPRYAAELREAGMARSSVNQRLLAIHKFAAEAAYKRCARPAGG
jgi:hypothetical protein